MHPIAALSILCPRHSVVRLPSFRWPFDVFFSASHEFQEQGLAAIPARRTCCDNSVQRLAPRVEHRGGGAGFERPNLLFAPGALASADVPRTSHREPYV